MWLGVLVLSILVLASAPWGLLLPKVAVGGTVQDRATAEPVGGARVTFGGATATTTDTAGAFSVDRASLTESLRVEADGYQPRQVSVWPPNDKLIELQPRTFVVDVRDAETNDPIPAAALQAEGVRFEQSEPGRFQVEPARIGVSLTITAPGFRDQTVRYRGDGDVVAAMKPRLQGVVMDGTTGRLIPGAFLSHADGSTTTDDGGEFELESRPNGPLRVMAPGFRRLDLDTSQDRLIVARLEPLSVRALYLTYFGVGDRGLRQNVLSLTEKTEANALVIDVKGDKGRLSYRSAVPLAETIGANSEPTVPNIDELMASLKERNIYTIARIVVFRDDLLARNGLKAGLDLAVKDRLGDRPWVDAEGIAWVDPFRPEVWEYNIALAREAAAKGFDEVQFDFVRFPLDSAVSATSAGSARYSRIWVTERDRVDTVTGFLRKARDELRPDGTFVAADVSGLSAWNDGDSGVGHDLAVLADSVDYICPTVFPSSFRTGLPNLLSFAQAIQRPYDVVFESMKRAKGRTEEQGAVLRPWLQYFDDYAWQSGRQYRAAEIDAQRNAAVASGPAGWMMWDPSNRYARGGLGTRP